jgi:hypothetical protein
MDRSHETSMGGLMRKYTKIIDLCKNRFYILIMED